MVYIIDTHTLVWFLEKQDKLSKKVREVLKNTKNRIVIPSIVLAEIKYLSVKGKISSTFKEILNKIEEDNRCAVVNLDINIINQIPTTLEIHDGIIVATALVYKNLLGEDAIILSCDEDIIKSNLVKVEW